MPSGTTTTRVNFRSGPGTAEPVIAVLEAGTPVEITGGTGDWLQVRAGERTGFVHGRFVAREENAVPPGFVADAGPFGAVPLAPADPIVLPAKPTSAQRLAAATWNHAGGLLEALAGHLKFHTGAAVAVFGVESGGDAFGPDGRMVIRFENHHFYRNWGRSNGEQFAAHFQFNQSRQWTGHRWRPAAGEWRDVHAGQSSEWDAFQFARSLDETAAMLSISMGGPQIMGMNFADAGFESVRAMFDAFSAGERRQIVAFFDFLQGPGTQPRKVLALQRQDFATFASLYNGPGNAAEYSARIGALFDAFCALRKSRGDAALAG
jgi:hypothetical protein